MRGHLLAPVPLRQKIHRPSDPGSHMNASALLHLLQFASPALPIGGYSYSQGLEAALEAGLVHDADGGRARIARHLGDVVAQWDAPLFWRLLKAFEAHDDASVALWSERFLASRDTAEFRAETIQMGYSLTRLIAELGVADVAGAGAGGDAADRVCLRRRFARHPARGSAAGDAVFLG